MQTSRLALCAFTITAACASEPESTDVIATVGHGRYISNSNRLLEPSPALFERTQRALLDRLTAEARAAGVDVDAERARVTAAQSDTFLANAELIDALIAKVGPGDHATLHTVNIAIRTEYARTLPADIAATAIPRVTFNSGQKYIDECRAADVPIPPPVMSTADGWVNHGSLAPTNFLGGDAEVWEYRAENGVCIALPRWIGNIADVAGLICLGTRPTPDGRTKACFWDSPRSGPGFPKGVAQPLTNFVGGWDLEANAQGVCTDCHAGGNPFVIHPLDSAMAAIGPHFAPDRWYEPIVHPNWPQNRAPTNLLAGVPSLGRCDRSGCHASVTAGGLAGQFPVLSTELPGYCHTVLAKSAGIFGEAAQTMPLGGSVADFVNHRLALEAACRTKPDGGLIVTSPSSSGKAFVSAPTLQPVAYDCAQNVDVDNVALDATVTLTVNSTVYTQLAKNVRHIEFALSAPLVVGDVITATQMIGGITSPPATVTVRDHLLDFPGGRLPPPVINPDLIYECADVIAVAHVPGATVTVSSSVGPDVTGSGGTGWTSFWPGSRSFIPGDTFSAVQRMCPSDPLSEPSPTARAGFAPLTVPTPVLDPARAFEGQKLTNITNILNGSHTTFTVGSSFAGMLDSPISWWTNFNLYSSLGRALDPGDTLSAQSRLCESSSTITTVPVSACQGLPAPRIETPVLPGATAVVVAFAQPGARIRVYDSGGNEIGNGSGLVINLARTLRGGEAIIVVQELGSCRSSTAHQVNVLPG
jgi:hypothetical protein